MISFYTVLEKMQEISRAAHIVFEFPPEDRGRILRIIFIWQGEAGQQRLLRVVSVKELLYNDKWDYELFLDQAKAAEKVYNEARFGNIS